MYRPYSAEWHRRRYLKEAIDKYFDDCADNNIIMNDIMGILNDRVQAATSSLNKSGELIALFEDYFPR
jgi:hypothetical protein